MSRSTLSRTPRAVWIALAVAVLLDTTVELVWKSVVLRVPNFVSLSETVGFVSREPLCVVLVTLFVLQFANWLHVLSRTDLSFAQPITALSYVTVGGASRVILGEELPWLRIAGIGLIVGGVWLISRTDHRGDPRPGALP